MDLFDNDNLLQDIWKGYYEARKNKRNTMNALQFEVNLEHFMRSATENYTKEAYVLKLDLQGFFMSIDKGLLLRKVQSLVDRKYEGEDKSTIQYLLELIILNDPTLNCKVKGKRSDWEGLPNSKSLFHAKRGCGLPIGNLTSQVFANYYLTAFDRYMKETLKQKCYGRYVDDFFVVHSDQDYLKLLVPILRDYLKEMVGVTLHPNKIHLQCCSRGVSYLGIIIKPYDRFLTNRIWNNVHQLFNRVEEMDLDTLYPEEKRRLFASLESYWGMRHHANVFRRMASVGCQRIGLRASVSCEAQFFCEL